VSASYLIMVGVAYEAAVSSARGYGDVLREFERHVTQVNGGDVPITPSTLPASAAYALGTPVEPDPRSS
jgi:hypothetical protein